MALVTLNGVGAVAATLCLPRVGAWTADIVVASDSAPLASGPAAIVAGALTFRGTVARGGAFLERTSVRVVGGAGGLGKLLDAKSYRGVPASIVIGDILGGAGERLAATVAPSLLAMMLPSWVRVQASAGAQLALLADALGTGWRVLADGSVWLGTETWPAGSLGDAALVGEWPDQARAEFAIESPALLAGTTARGRRVDYVEHHISADGLRTRVWYAS